MAATVASICIPDCAKGGSVAVTITAAVFFTRMVVGFTVTPICCSILVRLCAVKSVCCRSPVPFRPTTMP